MKKFIVIVLAFSTKICFSYCQPAISTYDFIATMNGTMKKELICQNKKLTIKSRMLVDLWIYKVTYDETAVGEKNNSSGVKSGHYKVEDSRKSKIIDLQVEKNGVDLQSVPYILGHELAKKQPISKIMKVFSEKGGGLCKFQVLNRHEKINTPLGRLDTVEIQGKCESGDQLTYWLWKKNYSMVKEDFSRNGDSQFEATIATQSAQAGCCWS